MRRQHRVRRHVLQLLPGAGRLELGRGEHQDCGDEAERHHHDPLDRRYQRQLRPHGVLDGKHPIRLSQSTSAFDGRAIVVTPQAFQPGLAQQWCHQAYREIDKTTPASDLAYTCGLYTDFFQFFVGLQVAGPRLGPTSIDKGFHAIPQRYFGTPTIPACFYLPGDYTCVKDAAVHIWDAHANASGDQLPGCWKAIEGGQRYAADKWPKRNIDEALKGNEPCSGYDTRVRFSPV
jgi:hypothetical protein